MPHATFCLPSFLLAISLALGVQNAWSQGYDPKRSTGSPLTVYNGMAIDNVDLFSGNLRITIPLLHLPSRGLDTDIVLTYNSKIWNTSEYIDGFSGYRSFVSVIDDDTNQTPAPGWGLGVPRMGRGDPGSVTCLKWSPDPHYCDLWGAYARFVANDGTRIVLGNDNGPQSSFSQLGNYWSFDGTYMRWPDKNARLALYKDGVIVQPFASPRIAGPVLQGSLKDTNGNLISCTKSYQLLTPTHETCIDTIGRTIDYNYDATGLLQTLTYRDSLGTPQSISFGYQIYTVYYWWATQAPGGSCSLNPPPDCGGSAKATIPLLRSVTLPSKVSYQFEYSLNPDGTTTTGEISKVVLPTGGYINYTYGWVGCNTLSSCSPRFPVWTAQNRAIASRVVSDDGTTTSEKTWSYSLSVSIGPDVLSKVTDPLGSSEVVTKYEFTRIPVAKRIEFRNSAGVAVKTILQSIGSDDSSYNDPDCFIETVSCGSNPRITSRTIVLNDTGQQLLEVFGYGTSGNVTQKDEYDWGNGVPGSFIRRTTFSYLHDAHPTYAAPTIHILDRKTSEQILDPTIGLTTPAADTQFEYDNYTEGIAPVTAVRHDPSFGTTYTTRGNLTALRRWRNTDGAWLTFRNQYDDVGNIRKITDPLLHSTTFAYSDSWANSICAPNGSSAAAYPTTITNALSQTTQNIYYSCSGMLAATADFNNQVSMFKYDVMQRLMQTNSPDGGQTTLAYNEAVLPMSITSTTKIDDTKDLVSTSVYDGLGRQKQTELNSDPQGVVFVRTTYDALGRTATVSNPYRSTSDQTYGITNYEYDALGRIVKVIPPDGFSSSNYVLTQYCGNAMKVTDQVGKWRRNITDALGRLIEVDEPNSSTATVTVCPQGGDPIAATSYTYDALGNPRTVLQSGSRQRTFSYNSLSQLTQSTNPESQLCLVTYTYDDDGNVLSKTGPRPNQTSCPTTDPATSVTTNYTYDALHRITQRRYSDGTPAADFTYDLTFFENTSFSNAVGRLVRAATPNARSYYSYDSMGRVARTLQCTPATGCTWSFQTDYSYNLAGRIASYTQRWGATTTYTYTFNGANRPTQVTSSFVDPLHPGTLGVVNSYHPHGAINKITYGNSLVEARQYNNRLQPAEIRTYNADTGVDTLKLNYGFTDANGNNNGNVIVWSATAAQRFTRRYTYDELNRLKTLSAPGETCTGLSWNHDTWGNRNDQNVAGGACPTWHFPANEFNRITGFSYDAAGNILSDGSFNYTYDAENRLTAVNGGAVASYVYDASGRRVRKGVSGTTTDYVYDPTGNTIGEWTDDGWAVGYVYLNDELLATYTRPVGILFTHRDHIGSTRLMTDVNQSIRECDDYFPYGEPNSCGSTNVTTHKFAGKERDGETEKDNFGARYYSSSYGRFMSSDPVVVTSPRMIDPQRFNAYAYGRNNPLGFIDPDGRDVQFANDTDEGRKAALARVTKSLREAETANIGIRKNKGGKYEAFVKDPKAVALEGASAGYQRLTSLISDHSIIANVGLVGGGLSATLGSLGRVSSYNQQAATFEPGRDSKIVDVLVTQGDDPRGVNVVGPGGTEVVDREPDFVTMAHELFGETLKYRAGFEYLRNEPMLDSKVVIGIENEIRQFHGLPRRTGSDHGQTVIIIK